MASARLGDDPSFGQLAFNTVAWWTAPIEEVVGQLAGIGYGAIELAAHPTALPPAEFNPYKAAPLQRMVQDTGLKIAALNLTAPYLLSETAFEPSFLAAHPAQRNIRIEMVRRGIDFAADLGADLIVISSGAPSPDITRQTAMCHLIEGLEACIGPARQMGVRIALKPSPFDLIDGYRTFLELGHVFEDPFLGLCLDIAGSHCVFEDVEAVIHDAPSLFHVHIADIRDRAFQHRIPGHGQIDFLPALQALGLRGYDGAITVNLPAHSLAPDRAATVARTELLNIWPRNGARSRRAEERAGQCL